MYLAQVSRSKPAWWKTDPQAQALEKAAGAACSGVRMLKRLTRMTAAQRQLLAQKKVEVIPVLYELKRAVDALRKAGVAGWQEHAAVHRAVIIRLWGKDYAMGSEANEMARARCELASAKVDAWEVLAPAAVAGRVSPTPTTEKERLEQRVNEMLKPPKR